MLYPAELLRQVTVAIIPVFHPDCKCPLQFCARFLILQDGHEPLHGLRLRGNLRQYREFPPNGSSTAPAAAASLAVSALRIMRYCLNIPKAAEKGWQQKSNRPETVGHLYKTHFGKSVTAFAGFVRYRKEKKLRQHLCPQLLVGTGGFASRGLKTVCRTVFCRLRTADLFESYQLQHKKNRNLSCGSFCLSVIKRYPVLRGKINDSRKI